MRINLIKVSRPVLSSNANKKENYYFLHLSDIKNNRINVCSVINDNYKFMIYIDNNHIKELMHFTIRKVCVNNF